MVSIELVPQFFYGLVIGAGIVLFFNYQRDLKNRLNELEKKKGGKH